MFSTTLFHTLAGAEYHVDPRGVTNATGSAQDPFDRLAAATAVVAPGDTVIIHAGTYRETLRPAQSGALGAPIVFRAAEDENGQPEQVIISGCDIIEPTAELAWELHAGSIYKITLDDTYGLGGPLRIGKV